jgi:hypothetical protein
MKSRGPGARGRGVFFADEARDAPFKLDDPAPLSEPAGSHRGRDGLDIRGLKRRPGMRDDRRIHQRSSRRNRKALNPSAYLTLPWNPLKLAMALTLSTMSNFDGYALVTWEE